MPPSLLPTLPHALTRQGVHLRPRQDSDAAAMDALYQAWRAEQFIDSGLSHAQSMALAEQQCQMQQRHYQQLAEPVGWGALEVNGELVGRLYLQPRDDGALHVLDVLLHPTQRSQGLGSAILAVVQAHAQQHGWRQVTLAVELTNLRALQLYQRLGFAVQGVHGVHAHMAWTAPSVNE